MPIVVKVVSEEEYKEWLRELREVASISGDRQKSIALAEKN